MNQAHTIAQLFERNFPYQATVSQQRFFKQLGTFFQTNEQPYNCFILRGYAGTGKTTLISSLIQSLRIVNYTSVLLAPTGRAAKVMATYAKRRAFTVHKKIYKQIADPATGQMVFARMPNMHTNTLFIVDEASMITDEADFGARSLLDDLVRYVFEGENNKLLFVGDTAQLPPVGKQVSPALDKSFLEKNFGLWILEEELTEVMRQEQESGILWNATQLRQQLKTSHPVIKLYTQGFRDTYQMTSDKLEDGLRYAYKKFGEENTIVVTRSNKTAVLYNQYIRRMIRFSEDELDAGDRLMIVRNNYNTIEETSPAGFLANGDFVELLKIRRLEEMHGFRFADVILRLPDFEDMPSFDAKIILDTLHSSSPALTQEEYKKLYESVVADYQDIQSKNARMEAIRKDPYLNALQVKFAYALTCHKAQGGQWNAVFIDQGYMTLEQVNTEFIRWLYTAITRSINEMYLMNFHESFFESPQQ